MKNGMRIIIWGAIGILFIGFFSISFMHSSKEEVFPRASDKNYFFGSYHEDIEENFSTVNLDTTGGAFKMTYRLSKATRNPYVGGFINKTDSTTTLANYHDHNKFKINLKSKLGMKIPIIITFDYKDGEKKYNGKDFPMLSMVKHIHYTEPGEYSFFLNEMEIPDWWFRVHRIHRDEVNLDKIQNVRGIVVGSCAILREKLTDEIEIKGMSFYTDNSILLIRFTVVVVFLTLVSLVLHLWRYAKMFK